MDLHPVRYLMTLLPVDLDAIRAKQSGVSADAFPKGSPEWHEALDREMREKARRDWISGVEASAAEDWEALLAAGIIAEDVWAEVSLAEFWPEAEQILKGFELATCVSPAKGIGDGVWLLEPAEVVARAERLRANASAIELEASKHGDANDPEFTTWLTSQVKELSELCRARARDHRVVRLTGTVRATGCHATGAPPGRQVGSGPRHPHVRRTSSAPVSYERITSSPDSVRYAR